MSGAHIEWGHASGAYAEYLTEKQITEFAEVEDYHPKHKWLVITTLDGNGIALDGTPDQLRTFAAKILTELEGVT